MGCSGDQPSKSDTTTNPPTLNVCKTWFASKVWGADLNSRTQKYDACGFSVGNPALVVSPSHEYTDAYDFVSKVKPIQLENYDIVLTDTNCLFQDNLKFSIGLILLVFFTA